jgi:hypothetical protein
MAVLDVASQARLRLRPCRRLHADHATAHALRDRREVTGNGKLRSVLEAAMAEYGCTMADLTVLDKANDPFRGDTPARHRDGEWLATTAADLGLGDRTIHLRGLHYMLIGQPKPDGTSYANTEKDWQWLSDDAAKAARFLGYIPFGQITDQRNTPPVIREFKWPRPGAYLSTDLDIEIPDDIEPTLYTDDFRGVQPRRLVLIGEKSSLEPVLRPIADGYRADLYLPTGEPSDTMLHQMARTGAEDGRTVVVLYFSDCDPSGWQMPVSVGRKLQAFRAQLFPALEFAVYRVALTPDQVREYDLPSTPLKDTEKRADKWQQAKGVQQTEIDSIAALRPDLLRQIARAAIAPFYDYELDRRVARYRDDWLDRARETIAASFDLDRLAEIRRDAEMQLDGMREQIRQLNDALRINVDPADLPPIDLPEAAEPEGVASNPPLIDSRWDFAEQCRALIDSKAYRNGDAP